MVTWLPIAAAGAAFLQIVLGGVVRVSSSGLGCPGWPLCPGLLPPGEVHAIIEYSHRVVGALASILIVTSAATAWLFYRRARGPLLALSLAACLLAVEVVLGALTVVLRLPPWMVLAHLGTALLILGLLVAGATLLSTARQARRGPLALAWIAAAGTFALALSGALVVGSGSSSACPAWPLCGGGWALETEPTALTHLLHRFLAATVGLVLLALVIRAWQRSSTDRVLRGAASGALAVFLLQAAVGGLTVSYHLPPGLRGLHLALASALWGAVVLALARAATVPVGVGPPPAAGNRGEEGLGRLRSTVRDYVSLTKPRIIGLLLVTALGALLLPGHGWPPLPIVVLTLLGGGLAAASANTLNCWLDRDIDQDMRRTRARPLPAGRISPRSALVFGLLEGMASFLVLGLFVNLLAAALAAAALLFYVLVYTLWLKRSTPQNIVIGGAAGAVPPLVAWAAVTHSLDLTALYLFAIIFFWTPPHFWALALLARSDYARARVPMLPVVSGEQVTRRLILLYSLVLVTVTVLLFVTRALGAFYLVAALALGGIFIMLAVQTLRDRDLRWARRLFHYSIAYLAVLFAAMVADRMLVS